MTSGSTAHAVTIDRVTVTFGDLVAVDEVSLDIAAGEVFGILGPSGSGKSSLLRAVAGLLKPAGGDVRFDDIVVTHRRPDERNIGMMFQDHALFPHMSVHDNVAFGLRMAQQPAERIHQRVAEVLDLVGLDDFGSRDVATLSGGEQQRIALARAVAREPSLLMFDEPLASLDRALHRHLVHAVRDLVRTMGCTAIYVTHDQDEAFAVCDRIAIMRAGRVVQIGAPHDLVAHPANAFVADFVGHDNLFAVEIDGQHAASAIGTWKLGDLDYVETQGTHVLVVPGYAITLATNDAITLPRHDDAATIDVAATIIRRQFYTHQQVYTARTETGSELVIRQFSPKMHEVGTRATVRINMAACSMVPADDELAAQHRSYAV